MLSIICPNPKIPNAFEKSMQAKNHQDGYYKAINQTSLAYMRAKFLNYIILLSLVLIILPQTKDR